MLGAVGRSSITTEPGARGRRSTAGEASARGGPHLQLEGSPCSLQPETLSQPKDPAQPKINTLIQKPKC